MEGIIIVILFSLQLVSFFLIVILFAKLNKFKDLEKKQAQTVEEMDAALGAYLMEMKEENDRLIQKLSTIPKPENNEARIESKLDGSSSQQVAPKFVSPTTVSNIYKTNIEKQVQLEESMVLNTESFKSDTLDEHESNALSIAQTLQPVMSEQAQEASPIQTKVLSIEEMIFEMYNNGQSIEEIAKKLNKGKTEIELMIKFHT